MTSTSALGTTAPEGSCTVPFRAPRPASDWPTAIAELQRKRTIRSTTGRKRALGRLVGGQCVDSKDIWVKTSRNSVQWMYARRMLSHRVKNEVELRRGLENHVPGSSKWLMRKQLLAECRERVGHSVFMGIGERTCCKSSRATNTLITIPPGGRNLVSRSRLKTSNSVNCEFSFDSSTVRAKRPIVFLEFRICQGNHSVWLIGL